MLLGYREIDEHSIEQLDLVRRGGGERQYANMLAEATMGPTMHVGDGFDSLQWALSLPCVLSITSHDWKSSPSRHRLFGCHAGSTPQSGSASVRCCFGLASVAV